MDKSANVGKICVIIFKLVLLCVTPVADYCVASVMPIAFEFMAQAGLFLSLNRHLIESGIRDIIVCSLIRKPRSLLRINEERGLFLD